MKNKLYFSKTRPGAKIPQKRAEDAGYDVYACFMDAYLAIQPGEIVLIPTGIATAFDKRYALIAKERGSTGIKGMAVRMGVIDSGFRGEIKIAINNTTSQPILIAKEGAEIPTGFPVIHPYEKAIAQVILLEIPEHEAEEIPYEDLCKIESERGTGHLGSSNK